ncbi:large-conductance mechanosensitive channel protein MscL [Papillibacter cinnamivorans]|uniref:Large-conductance mechanosensitive channel n=1 Tax=Papillibacter cinnamivorans DSM 12816 TaxID=1122930 RepID=A0A1W2A8G8_9FIRM|nr:large-conductance mechanosensitive channel protein MscL [Papillibacter cinnamivorans]SMC57039.1 large conductance mechanosensitive channel [Papillibacter cinnamivorans DSM 12816]
MANSSKGFLSEFKTFALRGNVIDLAVGVIIGGAFGTITSSLVADIIMPFIGLFIGGIDFTSLTVSVGPIFPGRDPSVLNLGVFIQTVINFIILAFVVFLIVRGINRLREGEKRKEASAVPPAPPAPSKEELLLTEIRDILKEQNK